MGMGTTGLNAADRSRRDAEAFVNFSGIAHPGAWTRKKGVQAERSPLRTSRSPFTTCHNTRSPHPGHRTTTAETRGHLQLGLANSLFRTGSATPVPANGDFRAPAMRSTGFKTDLIPQPARVPPPNPRGLLARKELSRLGMAPPRRLRFAGRGLTAGWRKPSDKFFFFSSPEAGRASSPAAGGMRNP